MPVIEFDIPIASRIHPEADKARDEHLAWLRQIGFIFSAEAVESYEQQGAVSCVALMYPQVPYTGLLLAADTMGLTLCFDDYCSREAKDPERVAAFMGRFISLIQGTDLAGLSSNDPFMRGWLSIWERTSKTMSQRWKERALQTWRSFFSAWIEESIANAAGQLPRLDTFFELRRRAIGVRPFLDTAESGSGIELSLGVANHPDIQEMIDICTDICIYVNDVFSLERETATGELNNFVMVLQHERNWTCDQAVREARSLVAKQCQRFLEIAAGTPSLAKLLHLAPREEEDLNIYVDLIRGFIRGQYDWTISTLRYRPIGYEQARRGQYLEAITT